MKGELHIPDLPEVPVALSPVPRPGGMERRVRAHWLRRLRDSILSYLPLLLMVSLALVFVYGAVAYLRRRSEPVAGMALGGLEGGLA